MSGEAPDVREVECAGECLGLCDRHLLRNQRWRDIQGDIWQLGSDGLMHSHETAPFTREHVQRKWGPLVLVTDDSRREVEG